jgi:hypothetical protein
MKYRIKKKDLKYYPQERGWRTVFIWEYFYEWIGSSTYGIYHEPRNVYDKISFRTIEEAVAFIDDKKARETEIIKL